MEMFPDVPKLEIIKERKPRKKKPKELKGIARAQWRHDIAKQCGARLKKEGWELSALIRIFDYGPSQFLHELTATERAVFFETTPMLWKHGVIKGWENES